MQTEFSSQTLAEIFRDLYLGESSGVLQLSRADVEKRIYFDRGMILFAESPLADEDLGPRLVHEGKISSGALAEARRSISEPKDLAQALVNRGLIGKEALRHTVRFIVERVVRSVFQWEGGSTRFNEGWLLQEIFDADVVSTFEFILRGISRMVGFEPIHEALEGMSSRVRFRHPHPVPLERLALSPAHGFILSLVDGKTTVSDVLSIVQPAEEDIACRFLYGLLVMGVIEFDPPVAEGPFKVSAILRDHADSLALEVHQEKTITQAYEQIRGKTPQQLLGVAENAQRETVERAYQDAKEAFGRDRILPRVREKLRAELSVIESRLLEAYLTLVQAEPQARAREAAREAAQAGDVRASDLLMRVEADKTRAKRESEEAAQAADSYYGKAQQYAREGDYHNAIQYAKLAISYNQEDARFYYLLADCQARNPEARWQRMAEQNYVKATELDAWNVDYLITLGRFYKRKGLKLRARRQIERALEIAPGHVGAAEELAKMR